eukprot:390142-Prymnesium_polylepis.1
MASPTRVCPRGLPLALACRCASPRRMAAWSPPSSCRAYRRVSSALTASASRPSCRRRRARSCRASGRTTT